ncbi:MAG: thiamine ABC transporter substrate-binding protein, partial [Actinomycetota bacterium]
MRFRHAGPLALIVAMLLTSCGGANEPVTLTLLAHDSFTPSEGIFDQFTADTGIRVQVVRSGDAGTLVTKAVLAAGNPEADVL